jgi:DEAD/DEAH box helicase domain-containing protein
MDIGEFLEDIRQAPGYRDQIVYVREYAAREAQYADPEQPLTRQTREALAAQGVGRLYTHQAEAVDRARAGEDLLVVTGTASGKSLCYQIPIIETLLADPDATALLLFPTKALCQDQFRAFSQTLDAAGMDGILAGVYDGDTSGNMRRRLREGGSVIFSNPDMVHAAMMPQHARWAEFISRMRIMVLDEMHVYSGIMGSNMANLMRRLQRVFDHYGTRPQILGCSATISNPAELAEGVTGREMTIIERDGSPRGARRYVLWNPPRIRARDWRGRRSANVEAHELMAELVKRGTPTITFSKAKMTAEMIHRYVTETLERDAPGLASRVTPYRGGYLPTERREIERRLFEGELLGVSCTRALELGIDVGGLDAAILVGYPGTLASFFQQSGRAGRQDREALVVLVGLDTAINQYVMTHPEYLFERTVEEAVIEANNPFVITGHLRCACHELPLADEETPLFGPHAELALAVLEGNGKVRHIEGRWYHAAPETPQHEVPLRALDGANVIIQDVESGATLGEVARQDAPPILHPRAIYMHLGDTFEVQELDMERNVATVKPVEVDYNTQPLGGTDVHHVDHRLREKPFGSGTAFWGEVTTYSNTWAYEKVRFYELDAVSVHDVTLPTTKMETMSVWIVPPEELMEEVRAAGLDAHSGLRGIGYGTRMILPAFMTCDTLDFSHSVGSANSPWNAVFIWERFLHGLGFTEKVYERLHEILPAALDNIRRCPCADGCPCCVGKPLRQYDTWNVERGEGHIPGKRAALMILDGLIGDGTGLDHPDAGALADSGAESRLRLEKALRRRLEVMRDPRAFHPIKPEPLVHTEYPDAATPEQLDGADVAQRRRSRTDLAKELRRRTAKKLPTELISAHAPDTPAPPGMKLHTSKPPTTFPGRPETPREDLPATAEPGKPIAMGDSLAAKARRLKKQRETEQ